MTTRRNACAAVMVDDRRLLAKAGYTPEDHIAGRQEVERLDRPEQPEPAVPALASKSPVVQADQARANQDDHGINVQGCSGCSENRQVVDEPGFPIARRDESTRR